MNKLSKSTALIAVTTPLAGCGDMDLADYLWLNNPLSVWSLLIIASMAILLHALLTKGKEGEASLPKALISIAVSAVIVLVAVLAGANLNWMALATGLPALIWMAYVEIADCNKPISATTTTSTGKLANFLKRTSPKEEVKNLTGPTCECGAVNPEGYRFCRSCGEKPATTNTPRAKTTTNGRSTQRRARRNF